MRVTTVVPTASRFGFGSVNVYIDLDRIKKMGLGDQPRFSYEGSLQDGITIRFSKDGIKKINILRGGYYFCQMPLSNLGAKRRVKSFKWSAQQYRLEFADDLTLRLTDIAPAIVNILTTPGPAPEPQPEAQPETEPETAPEPEPVQSGELPSAPVDTGAFQAVDMVVWREFAAHLAKANEMLPKIGAPIALWRDEDGRIRARIKARLVA